MNSDIVLGVILLAIILLLLCPTSESYRSQRTFENDLVSFTRATANNTPSEYILSDDDALESQKEMFEETYIADNRKMEHFGANPYDQLTDTDFAQAPFSSGNMEP